MGLVVGIGAARRRRPNGRVVVPAPGAQRFGPDFGSGAEAAFEDLAHVLGFLPGHGPAAPTPKLDPVA
eukprot:CAMPEP_0171834128 /NCGR_PEP_ID=MMETSP0992-20121227/10254_1 /TAXON_ID=483369 /ORGANISM="non described non described, Strain CCMP2098" /LENGTH=67 /DNA_ID=CAMNT_0012449803 /DNA_START=598 /DNA_END=798 /DNA_ORIENTATION=+